MRVGVLGGSFNPAHGGHRHIARVAMRRLRLGQVWLLVSPGNPLKPARGMAPLGDRLASATAIADGRRVVATAAERDWGTRYTSDTVRVLRRRFPRVQFAWLMGADILAELPAWHRWRDVTAAMPLAVLPRPGYNHRALAGQAAQLWHRRRMPSRRATLLAGAAPPAWAFLPAAQNAISATALRAATLRGRQEGTGR